MALLSPADLASIRKYDETHCREETLAVVQALARGESFAEGEAAAAALKLR